LTPATKVYTDGAQYYRFMPSDKHATVNHSAGEYVRYTAQGKVHTNSVEGVFSIFRRGMVGNVPALWRGAFAYGISPEFDFRYSNRIALGVDDAMRADIATKQIVGKRLTLSAD
jgi:hypothetical protein